MVKLKKPLSLLLGLRKVYPYTFTFATHAKGRWVGRTIKNVLEKEFGFDQPEDLVGKLLFFHYEQIQYYFLVKKVISEGRECMG